MAIEFRILGPLEVLIDGAPVEIRARQQRVLLCSLLVAPGEIVSTDRLVDALWREVPPPTARQGVQNVVAELRRMMEPGCDRSPIVRRASGYLIHLGDSRFDVVDFEAALEEGRASLAVGDHANAARRLREALVLWRGQPMDDVTYEAFAAPAIRRLGELRLLALESRIEADLALGQHASLVGELSELVAANPMRERLRGSLMVALYRCGRQAEALDVYRVWRLHLSDMLGLDPSPDLRRLESAILRRELESNFPEHPAPPGS